jgi:hypothetical protein
VDHISATVVVVTVVLAEAAEALHTMSLGLVQD